MRFSDEQRSKRWTMQHAGEGTGKEAVLGPCAATSSGRRRGVTWPILHAGALSCFSSRNCLIYRGVCCGCVCSSETRNDSGAPHRGLVKEVMGTSPRGELQNHSDVLWPWNDLQDASQSPHAALRMGQGVWAAACAQGHTRALRTQVHRERLSGESPTRMGHRSPWRGERAWAWGGGTDLELSILWSCIKSYCWHV